LQVRVRSGRDDGSGIVEDRKMRAQSPLEMEPASVGFVHLYRGIVEAETKATNCLRSIVVGGKSLGFMEPR
jgi:hypothetical protein